jgi:DNA-binding CsgD family transcriptional regulator
MAPGERERARSLLTAREYDAWRMRRAGYSKLATAGHLGISVDRVTLALRRADELLGSAA